MEIPNNIETHLSEGIVTEILARLPLRSIFRFKAVCRTWKSVIESLYLRRLFISLHQNTSTPWSVLWKDEEFIDCNGCETWSLPKSLGSYIPNIPEKRETYVITSNGLVWIERSSDVSYVGNPILQQWVAVSYPPHTTDWLLCNLVTRVDDDGVVLSFKLIRGRKTDNVDTSSTDLEFCVYSSETGNWTSKHFRCPHYFLYHKEATTLHGTIYISTLHYESDVNDVLIVHDFYRESNECRVIPLPHFNRYSRWLANFKSALTISTGFVMYIKILPDNILKVWRLSNKDAWEPVWETNLLFIPTNDIIINYAPLAMHLYDPNIVYIWSIEHRYLVSFNLETQNYRIFTDQSVDDDDLHVNHSLCEKHIGHVNGLPTGYFGINVISFQHVLPRWMASIPRPPNAEILDTTRVQQSLLSHMTCHTSAQQSDS